VSKTFSKDFLCVVFKLVNIFYKARILTRMELKKGKVRK
jgi:hypothetical protein